MKKVYLIFGRSYLPISVGIQVITVCRWSHVGLLVGDTVYEARGGFGVVATPLAEFQERYRETLVRVMYCRNDNVVDDIIGKVGLGYDDKAFWSIAIERLSRGLLRLDWDDINAYQCAELIAKYSGNFDHAMCHPLVPKDILRASHAIT